MGKLGRALFIVNPAAQNGRGAEAVAFLEGALRDRSSSVDGFDVVTTTGPGHARELASAAGSYDTVVAVGGDGVMHEIVGGLHRLPKEDRPAFGLIPCGNGNDYARTIRMPVDLQKAFDLVLENNQKQLDLGVCNGETFAETLSFGLDAAIAIGTQTRRERTGQQGTMLFVREGIDQLLHHLDTYEFFAVLDDKRTIADKFIMFATQIGPTYGGGFKVCPDADPADGIFEICYAHAPLGLFKAAPLFLRAKNGGHVGSRHISFDRCSKMHIAFNEEPPAQMDGERVEGRTFDVAIDKGALNVIVGKGE